MSYYDQERAFSYRLRKKGSKKVRNRSCMICETYENAVENATRLLQAFGQEGDVVIILNLMRFKGDAEWSEFPMRMIPYVIPKEPEMEVKVTYEVSYAKEKLIGKYELQDPGSISRAEVSVWDKMLLEDVIGCADLSVYHSTDITGYTIVERKTINGGQVLSGNTIFAKTREEVFEQFDKPKDTKRAKTEEQTDV